MIDANVFLRIMEQKEPAASICDRAIKILLENGHEVCVTPAVVEEIRRVGTRGKKTNGLGLESDAVAAHIKDFACNIVVCADPPELIAEWMNAVTDKKAKHNHGTDILIAEAMKLHGIHHLLTINTKDFKDYAHVQAHDPEKLVLADRLHEPLRDLDRDREWPQRMPDRDREEPGREREPELER